MELFPWREEYNVNIAKIDAQHKRLVAVINQFHDAVAAGQSRRDLQKVFAVLLDYMLNHFDTEEALLLQYGFPDFEEHKKQHDVFRRKITAFLDTFLDTDMDVTMDMAQYLVTWLSGHVFSTDKKYSAFLNARGVF
mgnify:CR=1 FL=1